MLLRCAIQLCVCSGHGAEIRPDAGHDLIIDITPQKARYGPCLTEAKSCIPGACVLPGSPTTTTTNTIALGEPAEKGADADLLREIVAQVMMEMDVESLCAAFYGE